jgi:hypothetical protein
MNTAGGSGNTFIGTFAGCNNTTGGGNVYIGGFTSGLSYSPVFSALTANNRVAIGSTSVTNAYIQVAWTVLSDARDKTNVTALPVGLDFINKLNPVSYQFKESRECEVPQGPVHYGFLAQEVLEAEGENPVLIDVEDPEHLRITNDNMNAIFVKAIQELSEIVTELRQELNELKIKS